MLRRSYSQRVAHGHIRRTHSAYLALPIMNKEYETQPQRWSSTVLFLIYSGRTYLYQHLSIGNREQMTKETQKTLCPPSNEAAVDPLAHLDLDEL